MGANVFVFAGSGTGGHLVPGLAVADAIRRREPQADILFLTTGQPFDRELLGHHGYRRFEQRDRSYPTSWMQWLGYWLSFQWSMSACRSFFRREQPRAVIGLGGQASAPGVLAAQTLGIRTAIINPDAIPGRTNRKLAAKADLVIMQWEASRTHFPPTANCQPWGCPIREAFLQLAARRARPTADDLQAPPPPPDDGLGDSRSIFDLAWSRPVLLVSGATSDATGLNQIASRVWPDFSTQHPEWQLLHLAGKQDEAAVTRIYETAGIRRDGWRVLSYTHEMWHAIGAADVVITRAGASTIAELATLGKPSILMPLPTDAEQDQPANARLLLERGGAMRVEGTSVSRSAEQVRAALEQLTQRPLRETMAEAARKLARPSATEKIADWALANE